jgi:hypothetical protein
MFRMSLSASLFTFLFNLGVIHARKFNNAEKRYCGIMV